MIRVLLAAILACFQSAIPLRADGGGLLFQRRWGPLVMSLFADPSPIRLGRTDFSVLLQTDDGSAVVDARVLLTFTRADHADVRVPLTHSAATNHLLQAAFVDLQETGDWSVVISIERGAHHSELRGEVKVHPNASDWQANWIYFALVPAAILLYIVNRTLKGQRRSV